MTTTITAHDGARDAATAPARPSTAPAWQRWLGRGLSGVLVLMLTMSAAMKLSHSADFVAKWTQGLGFPESTLTGIGVLELVCVAFYVIPRTAPVGAVLVSAYLGGAVASHVRISDAFVVPVALGLAGWAGILLRDARLRAVLFERRPA